MLKIREVKTASGSIAIQVVYYLNRKRLVLKHIGSAKEQLELENLKLLANEFIQSHTNQLSVFPNQNPNTHLYIEHTQCIGFYYRFFYDTIQQLMTQIGFDKLSTNLFRDLVIIRILEPASKMRSIALLETYFGIIHRRQSYYREVRKWLSLKEQVQQVVLSFAQKEYGFDYRLLFYDVTTLYFETFESDELRNTGFSKDNKSQQPQILIGLMVNKDGFPIAYDIYTGNTFEGHTIIPMIKPFVERNKVKNFTVVADAAMISTDNINELRKENIHYIVGARLGNLSQETFALIDSKMTREDAKTIRVNTSKGYLICSYSSTRYKKDKYEMEKLIIKAKAIVEHPSKNKRTKFVKTNKEQIELNKELINKTSKLLGLKGYYTDLEETVLATEKVINLYHELYKIEQVFRIAKSDLETRPIFHFKEEPIKLHLLICFMALVLSKHIELKTGSSIKHFITECKKVTDTRMLNTITQRELIVKGKMTNTVTEFLSKLNLPH
ncbi:MAG: IS1634 family transposase [Chitinophagales bacterium]|nr:IS1634 family transposase [Chitinophagales bacterium]